MWLNPNELNPEKLEPLHLLPLLELDEELNVPGRLEARCAARQVRIGVEHADRHRAHGTSDPFELVDALLIQLAIHERDQEVPDLEQLGGA